MTPLIVLDSMEKVLALCGGITLFTTVLCLFIMFVVCLFDNDPSAMFDMDEPVPLIFVPFAIGSMLSFMTFIILMFAKGVQALI